MRSLTKRTREGVPIALRLDRQNRVHPFISYDVAAKSSTPRDETELSWELFSDHVWPTDAWVVGADVHPDLWPAGDFGQEAGDE